MRRYIYILLFFIVLVAPFVFRRVLAKGGGVNVSGEVAGTLTIVTPHNQDIRREFARGFNEWHLKRYGEIVRIDYLTPGGSNDIKRLLETTYRGWRNADKSIDDAKAADVTMDIVWGGGDYLFEMELNRELGVLQAMEIDPALLAEAFPNEALAGVSLREVARDKDGELLPPKWVGVCLSAFGIVYNPEVYRTIGLEAPETWSDLTRPELANLIALADPARSGSAAVAYLMVIQRAMQDGEDGFLETHPALKQRPLKELEKDAAYRAAIAKGWKAGMSQLLLIAANARYFTDSANLVPKDVSTGDAAAGMAIDFYGRTFEEIVGSDRLRYISPVAATAITPDPVAILRGVGGQRRVLANRFVEFMLSREGQLLWIKRPGTPGGPRERGLRRPPVRIDLYADRSDWTDDVNPFEEAGGFNQRPEWGGLFTDMRPIWAAAWIDTREDLKEAYATILAVPDQTMRKVLLKKLAELPVEMSDVADDRAERRAQPTSEAAIWQARNRMEWAAKFRKHYRQTALKAAAH